MAPSAAIEFGSQMEDHAVVLFHLLGVPTAVSRPEVAAGPDFPAQSGQDELVARRHEIEP